MRAKEAQDVVRLHNGGDYRQSGRSVKARMRQRVKLTQGDGPSQAEEVQRQPKIR